MEVRKVLQNKHTGLKYLVIPKNSDIASGDTVVISKVNNAKLQASLEE